MGSEPKGPPTDPEVIARFVNAVEDYVELEPDAVNSATQLIINWGKKGVGFGMLCLFEKDGEFSVDNEMMGKDFCKWVLERLIENPNLPMPPLLARFQTIDALLDVAQPTHGEW